MNNVYAFLVCDPQVTSWTPMKKKKAHKYIPVKADENHIQILNNFTR